MDSILCLKACVYNCLVGYMYLIELMLKLQRFKKLNVCREIGLTKELCQEVVKKRPHLLLDWPIQEEKARKEQQQKKLQRNQVIFFFFLYLELSNSSSFERIVLVLDIRTPQLNCHESTQKNLHCVYCKW